LTHRHEPYARPLALLLFCGLPLNALSCQTKAEPTSQDLLAPGGSVVGLTPAVHPVGATANARDYTLRVHNVRECAVEAHFRPPAGIKRLGVEVEMGGTSVREVPFNPFYATLVTPEGERYEPTLAGCQPGVRASRVRDGQTGRGWLSFDVPATASRLTLSYNPVVIGVGQEELLFELAP
jgi:hypothetical protein